MNGRGVHIIVVVVVGLLFSAPAIANAVPNLQPISPTVAIAEGFERYCQDTGGVPDYSVYFTRPERDTERPLVFVFYNNFIDREDNEQFAYALIYGLEYASENARPDDFLAVGLYFTDKKGKIYLIRKSVFDELQAKQITAEDLLDYIKVETVDIGESSSLEASTF
ncbi:MAG TPA: hypothetical protein ENN69_08290 [Spirochaetia bacterium]|nr:hypothetical protein [Spirochaetia bacterium]